MVEWFENDQGMIVSTSQVRYFQKNKDGVLAVFANGDAVSAMPPVETTVDAVWAELRKQAKQKMH